MNKTQIIAEHVKEARYWARYYANGGFDSTRRDGRKNQITRQAMANARLVKSGALDRYIKSAHRCEAA